MKMSDFMLAQLFLYVWCPDWKVLFHRMNDAITLHNQSSNKTVRLFTQQEFLTATAVMVAASAFGVKCVALWEREEDQMFKSIVPLPDIGRFMKEYRFKL